MMVSCCWPQVVEVSEVRMLSVLLALLQILFM